MHTNGKETVTDMSGDTKGTDCTINCVYHVSLPYKTELAQFKRSCLPFGLRCQFKQRDYFNMKTIWVQQFYGSSLGLCFYVMCAEALQYGQTHSLFCARSCV